MPAAELSAADGDVPVSVKSALRTRRVLYASSGGRDPAAVVRTYVCCLGHVRFRGFWKQAAGTAPAVGFPQIRFYQRHSAIDITITPGDGHSLVQDASQLPTLVWTWDEPIKAPYVEFIWTNGADLATSNGWAELIPSGE